MKRSMIFLLILLLLLPLSSCKTDNAAETGEAAYIEQLPDNGCC